MSNVLVTNQMFFETEAEAQKEVKWILVSVFSGTTVDIIKYEFSVYFMLIFVF